MASALLRAVTSGRRLGQAFLNQIRRQTDIVSDPEVETYIQSIGYRLVAQSTNSSQLFTFFVVDEPEMVAALLAAGAGGDRRHRELRRRDALLRELPSPKGHLRVAFFVNAL